jgi:hypothetical protein
MLKLIGYFAKRSDVPGDWAQWEVWKGHAPAISELCSVSDCLTVSPEGWVERFLHNDLAFFNSRADALSVIPSQQGGDSLFAYRLLSKRFVGGAEEELSIPDLPVEPLGPSFVSLGFDVVNKDLPDIVPYFECSPLSCNGMAAEVQVNTYCLIDTLGAAIAVAIDFSREPPEPGAYYVIEVLRELRKADA